MNCKKYRICLALFLVVILAGGVAYYLWTANKEDAPMDGMLVKEYEVCQDGTMA